MTDAPTRPGPITRVPMVGIHTTDTDLSLGFYRDVLGLEVVQDTHVEQLDGRLVILSVSGEESTVVALFPHGTADEVGRDTGIRFTVADAPGWHRYLQAAGSRVHELLEWPGVPPMFIFEDPDHNRLVIVS